MVKVNIKRGRKLIKSKRGMSKKGAPRMVKSCKSIKPKSISKSKRLTITKSKKYTKAVSVNRRNKYRSCRNKNNSVKSTTLKRRSKSRSKACRKNSHSVKSTTLKRRSKSRSKACRKNTHSVKSTTLKRRSKSRSKACRKNTHSVKSTTLKRRSKSRSKACRKNTHSVKSTTLKKRSKTSTRKSSRSWSSKNRKMKKCKKTLIKKGLKRPRSAYIFFYRNLFCKANEKIKITKISEFAKNAGKIWRSLNEADKAKYNKMAVNDQKRYFRITRGKKC